MLFRIFWSMPALSFLRTKLKSIAEIGRFASVLIDWYAWQVKKSYMQLILFCIFPVFQMSRFPIFDLKNITDNVSCQNKAKSLKLTEIFFCFYLINPLGGQLLSAEPFLPSYLSSICSTNTVNWYFWSVFLHCGRQWLLDCHIYGAGLWYICKQSFDQK